MDRPELLRLMPEHEAVRERLQLPCPKCRYPLVGLRPQRCPECGKHHGSVTLWAGYLRLTRVGKFIRRTLVYGFASRAVAPLPMGSVIEFRRNDRRSPAFLLASGAACLLPPIVLAFASTLSEPLVFAAVVMGLLGMAILLIALAKLIHSRRALVDFDRRVVTVVEQLVDLHIPRAAPIADAGLFTHERPEVSVFLRQRYFCTLFTTSTQFVLCTSKRREDVEAYVGALPEPMREMHISLLREEA